MEKIDVIKENVQLEQLADENKESEMINEEYLIPDTHPDVYEVLMVEAKPIVLSKDMSGSKLNVEGRIDYNVLYLAREEGMVVCSVNYSQKFSNQIELEEAEHKTVCEVDCRVEHIEAKIINERKVAINGILNLNFEVYKGKEVQMIKDIECEDGVEVLKKSEVINKTDLNDTLDIVGKSVLRVSMDKPQVSRILKSEIVLQKKEIKLGEDKAYCGCYSKIRILYCGNEGKEIHYLEDSVYISKELMIPEMKQDLAISAEFDLVSKDINVEEDDLGEARIVNIEFMAECKVKVFSKENIDVIMDAYSPKVPVQIEKEEVEMGMLHGVYNSDIVVKDNIYIKEDDMKPEYIVAASGNIIITDKQVSKDKLNIEGYIKVCAVYKTSDEEKYLSKVEGDIPFGATIEAKDADEKMKILAKACLEDLDLGVEANTIAVKANVVMNCKVLYNVKKELVSDIKEVEGEELKKKASLTIYVIGKGDTLWNLAKKYMTTMSEIMELNEMEDGEKLVSGEKILIPGRAVSK